MSVLVGGGGFVTWSPSRTSDSAAPLYLCVLVRGGGLLLIPCPPHSPPTLLYLYVLVGRDGFDQASLAHPRLRRGPRSARERQLTPLTPTRMSSVGSPATNSRSSCHDFCCNSNTTARPIQISCPTLPGEDFENTQDLNRRISVNNPVSRSLTVH